MQRILITTDAVGGVWSYTVALAKGMAGRGVEVIVLCLGPRPEGTQQRQLSDVDGVELVATDLPLEWMANDPDEIKAGADFIRSLAKERKVDTLHLHSPAFAAFGRHTPTVAVNHSCVGTWWRRVKREPMPNSLAWMVELVGKGLNKADMIVAPSRAFGRDMAEVYGLTRPVEVVHNGLDQSGPRPSSALANFAVFAGRLWDEAKNIPSLSAAATGCRLPIVVAGPLGGSIGKTPELGSLRYLGNLPQEELTRTLHQRPVFVSAATFEPFGLAVLEAAQQGCALVLSDIPTYRELWSGAALFVDGDNPDCIRASLDELASDPERRNELGKQAAERASRYSATRMCERTLDLHLGLMREECIA